MINLHRLEGFHHVALTGSYARAARSFPYPLTAPALHQQVRKLEGELGVRLLERAAKDRMVLTPEGRALHAFCAPFFAQLPALVDSLASRQLGHELRIGAAFLEMAQLLPPWIARLRREQPRLRLEIEELHGPDYERLRSGQLDLIVDHQPEVPHGVETRRIGTHHVFLASPKAQRLPPAKAALLEALSVRDFVSFQPTLPQYAMQMGGLARVGVTPRRVASASTAEGILRLVQSGIGWSLIPWPSARGPRLPGVHLSHPPGPRTVFPIHAAFRTGAAEHPLIGGALAAFRMPTRPARPDPG